MSKLKDIKDYYLTALQSIDGTGGYTNTIATINKKTINKLAEVSKGAAEVFIEIKSKKETGPSTTVKRVRTAIVEITGQVMNPLDADNNDEAIFSLDADIEKAIGVDTHCGGVAIKAKPIGTTFTYGDVAVQCVCTVEVQYGENVSP